MADGTLRYMLTLVGMNPVDMCTRCGALIATTRAPAPVGTVSPREAHDLFHDTLEQLVAAHNARAELEAEARERADG